MSKFGDFIETKEQIIIIYGIDDNKLSEIKKVNKKYNYSIIKVKDNETYCTVEDIIFSNTEKCYIEDTEPIDIEFLLFVNIINEGLYDFIADLKTIGLYFPNKAILTPTNLKWKLRRLLAENKEEHVVMTMFTNLKRAMIKAQQIVDNNLHDEELVNIMEKAKHYLNPREFDFDEMKNIHNTLARKVNSLGEINE